ncbi:MAG: hypothetical protein RLZZ11_2068 [Cyanobacteriota bacterium]
MNHSSVLALLIGFGLGGAGASWLGRRKPTRSRRGRPKPLEPPEQQLRHWIEAVPQGWLLIDADNRIASLNPRAELLLELEDAALSLRGEALAAVEPSDELQHLVDLARNTGFSQRGTWPLRNSNLDVRVMPGGQGWVAIVLQGRNPLESQLEQQEQADHMPSGMMPVNDFRKDTRDCFSSVVNLRGRISGSVPPLS